MGALLFESFAVGLSGLDARRPSPPDRCTNIPDRLRNAARFGCLVVAVPALIALSPLIIIILAWKEYSSRALQRRFERKYGTEVRGILVYSNSPNWQAYIEERWLPRIGSRLFVLNWSERSRWKREHPLEASLFRSHLGDREFNPAAIIFVRSPARATYRGWLKAVRSLEPIGMLAPYPPRVAVVRFFKAFRDFKHGREESLRTAEATLWKYLELE